MIDDGSGPPLLARVTIFALGSAMKSGIVSVKSSIKSGRGRTLGIEHLGSDKCRRSVAALVQQVGKIRHARGQRTPQVAQMIELRISASEDGGVRRRSERHLGIRPREDDAVASYSVQIRS